MSAFAQREVFKNSEGDCVLVSLRVGSQLNVDEDCVSYYILINESLSAMQFPDECAEAFVRDKLIGWETWLLTISARSCGDWTVAVTEAQHGSTTRGPNVKVVFFLSSLHQLHPRTFILILTTSSRACLRDATLNFVVENRSCCNSPWTNVHHSLREYICIPAAQCMSETLWQLIWLMASPVL